MRFDDSSASDSRATSSLEAPTSADASTNGRAPREPAAEAGGESSLLFGADRRVVALAVARMADALGNSFLIIVLPLYVVSGAVTGSTFGLSEAAIAGLVLALFGLVSSASQPLTGRLSDRLGRRRAFVLLGLVLFAAANFSFVYAGSYAALLAVRAAQGVAAAFTITASVALVSELSGAGGRGGNMGIYNSFRLVGFGTGPLIAGVLVEGGPYVLAGVPMTGFEAAFYVAAIAPLVSAALVVWLVEDPEETQPSTEKLAVRIRAQEAGRVLDPIFTLGLATFFMSACIALLATIEPQVNARLGQGAFLFSVEFAALIATLAAFQPIIGRASDRYGRKAFIVVGLLGLIPTTLGQGLVWTPWAMIACRALQGVSAAFVFAPALALAGDLAKKGQAAAQLSVLTVAFGLGISSGQLLSGFLIQFGFVAPFASGAVLAAVGAALVYTQVPSDKKG